MSGQDLELGDLKSDQVSTNDLREREIDCDELWDVDRMLSRAYWARYGFVRKIVTGLQRQYNCRGSLQLQIADILKPIALPVPPLIPAVREEEEKLEGEYEEITEAIEDELFGVHGDDEEEEIVTRIMIQDEIDRVDIDDIGSDDDFGNESELLQELDFDD
ncbi:hypothetical protein K440DRAFT_638912 [Wilcoxina mikolae CBS 423.85]|nr:hypothetical protein K440DRAFT_638912 [Wilcoxina mikolae CBS 423.85]